MPTKRTTEHVDIASLQNLREQLLDTAKAIVAERNETYDDPNLDFTRTANMWTALFLERGYVFTPDDVAKMMVCLKLSRLMSTPDHVDSWVDIAGYAACGFSVVNSPAYG